MNAAEQFDGLPAGSRPARVVLEVGVEATGLYPLRAAVAAHATDLGMGEGQLDKLLVVVTELATNVIRHGGGAGRLQLWRDADMIACQVTDDGPGIADPETAGMRPIPLDADCGRGLWIVRQLCDQVTIESNGHGSTVTASMTV